MTELERDHLLYKIMVQLHMIEKEKFHALRQG